MSGGVTPPTWTLAGLLRGLTAGHPSLRAQVLRLLERFPAPVLERDPVRRVFLSALEERPSWARGVGALVARRGLSSYAPLLVDLLRNSEFREAAEGWLRERTLVRPLEALVALVVDAEAPLEARLSALRLLKKQPLLDASQLLSALATPGVQAPLIEVLRPACDSVLVDRAIAANQVHGEALLAARRKRERGDPSPTFLERLLGARVTPLGVVAEQHREQHTFSEGVARLCAAAGDPRLASFAEWALLPEVGPVLRAAWRKHGTREVVAELVRRDPSHTPRAELATLAALIGDLAPSGDRRARRWLKKLLPPVGRPATAEARAAIVALGQLGDKAALAPLLDAALSALTQQLGQSTTGNPGHASTFDPCLQAAGQLKLVAWSNLALDALRSATLAPQLPSLPRVLTQLAPLELTPTLETVLNTRPRRETPWLLALETVRLTEQRELLKLAAETAGPQLDRVGLALAELLDASLLRLAQDVIERLSDEPGDRLLARAEETCGASAAQQLAQVVLKSGAGGTKVQRRALKLAVAQGGDVLAACAALFVVDDASVRRAALEEALNHGLLERDDLSEATAYDLLVLVREALQRGPDDRVAAAQVRLLLDATLPRDGQPGLGSEATRELRTRIRESGLWRESASFHALHRDLLELGDRGLHVGLFHGAVLSLLGTRRFRHPLTNVLGDYPGPLPRYPATLAATREHEVRAAHEARWLEEGLFDTVVGPGYLRPPSVVVAFLDAASARVRASALELLDRPAVLAHSEAVLTRLDDPHSRVRWTAVELLRRHELARFAPELTPTLRDSDDQVALAAARALAAWGERESLGHLVGFLDSPQQDRRREAVTCLRGFAPADLVGALAPLVGLSRPRSTAGVLAALRPGRLPDDPALRERLFEVAAHASGPLRAAALRLLPDLVGDDRLREVVPLLRDVHPDVRRAAAAVLRCPAGRKLASAVAELASEAEGAELRLELLGLLSDLDQPEAAKGVVELLLDDDARVRGEVRAALGARHGYSLGPDLERVLAQGLAGSAGPAALAELVQLLDSHVESARPFADALACEDRSVWEAALSALRRRKSTAHHALLTGFLSKRLDPCLLTLTIDEVHHLADAGEPLYALASKGPTPTVRRKALRALLASSKLGSDKILKQLVSEIEERARQQLTVHAADAERERTARGGRSRQRPPYELVQARATLGTCARLRLREVGTLRELGPTASALDAAVWRTNSTLRGELHARTADLASASPPRELGSLGLPPQSSLADVAWLARDRVEPATFLGWLAELNLERSEGDKPDYAQVRRTLGALRAGVVARLREGAEIDTSNKGALAKSLSIARYMPATWERFLLATAETWSPELSELLGAMVAAAGRELSGLPKRGYAVRRREDRFAHYARAALRLERHVQAKAFAALTDSPTLLGRLHAAQNATVDLLQAFERTHGEEETDARAEVLTLLGELGSAQARDVVAGEVSASNPKVRAAAARALGLAGDAAGARDALASLLGDDQPQVLVQALTAVGLLGDPAHVGAVRVHFGSAHDDVVLAACRAARTLPAEHDLRAELIAVVGRSREVVAPSTDPALAAHQWPTLAPLLSLAPAVKTGLLLFREALEVLGECGKLADGALRAALLEGCRGRQRADATLSALLTHVVPDSALDEVGALLGDDAPGTVELALDVLLAREHTPAYEAVPALLSDPRPELREVACAALVTLGQADQVPALEALYADPEQPPGVRAAALRALAALHPDRDAAFAAVKRATGLGDGAESSGPALRNAARDCVGYVGADADMTNWLLGEVSQGLFRRFALPGADLDADAAERAFAEQLKAARVRHASDSIRQITRESFKALLQLDPEHTARDWALRMAQRAVCDGYRGPALLEVLHPWLAELEPAERLAWLQDYAAKGARFAPVVAPLLLAEAPTVAARLLPVPTSSYGRRSDRQAGLRGLAVALAAAQDPESWSGRARELLFSPHSELRVLARAALGDARWEPS